MIYILLLLLSNKNYVHTYQSLNLNYSHNESKIVYSNNKNVQSHFHLYYIYDSAIELDGDVSTQMPTFLLLEVLRTAVMRLLLRAVFSTANFLTIITNVNNNRGFVHP